MQACSTCLHPIHGSTPSHALNCNGAQPVFSAPATLGTVPVVGSPLSQLTIGFCSIRGAQLRTQHHPLIGPLQLTGSCIPCTRNRQQTGLCSRGLQAYILQHRALLGSSADPRSTSKAIPEACLVEAVHRCSNILFLPPDKIKSRRELFVSSIPVLIQLQV